MSETMLVETAGFLCVLSFIVGAISGYILARGTSGGDYDDHAHTRVYTRDVMHRDVYTPGSKLVATPRVKPSSAWPPDRRATQRVQSQIEHGDVA